MKTFDSPKIEIVRFTVEDIVTSSVPGREDEFPISPVGANELPISDF